MNTTKKKIFVLTAAGFSQAYLSNSDGEKLSSYIVNETLKNKDFFSKHYSEIYTQQPSEGILKIQNLYTKVWDALQDNKIYSNQIYPPNFETVFYILNYLCQMQNPDKTINITGELHHTFFLPKFVSSLKPEWNDYFSIRDFYDFKNFLLAYVSKFSATATDLLKINKFITKLKENYSLRYYTLNYDNLFLKAVGIDVDKLSGSHLPNDINFGYGISANQIVSSQIFSYSKQHCCFHLHGSINYGIGNHTCTFHENEKDAFESRKKYIPEELNTGEIRDWSAFIIGYDKDKIMNLEPYSSFHLSMALDLLEAEEILILGYALNDEHINKWLMRLTSPLIAPYFQCDEVKENVLKSRVTKVEKITIVDYKTEDLQEQKFKDSFLTIARSSGERNLPNAFNMLTANKIENSIYTVKDDNFNLNFDFRGVDAYIEQYIK